MARYVHWIFLGPTKETGRPDSGFYTITQALAIRASTLGNLNPKTHLATATTKGTNLLVMYRLSAIIGINTRATLTLIT